MQKQKKNQFIYTVLTSGFSASSAATFLFRQRETKFVMVENKKPLHFQRFLTYFSEVYNVTEKRPWCSTINLFSLENWMQRALYSLHDIQT